MMKNSSEYANNNLKYNVRRVLAGVAIVGSAVGLAAGAAEGLNALDDATKHTVKSVTETMPQGGNYISIAKQAVVDLGLDPDNFDTTRIGQEVQGDPVPQPGQQVTFDEVQHWYGTGVEGSTVDTDK